MIKAIAFDYGGVIMISQTSVAEEICNLLSLSKETWGNIYFSLNHLCNTGTKTWEEVILMCAEEAGVTDLQKDGVQKLIEDDKKRKSLNIVLIEKIKELGKNYKVALMSNYSTQLRNLLVTQGIDILFDEIIISGEVGFQKPDPKIFELLCSHLKIAPNELIFIDDTLKSLESAESIGYTPLHFQNNEKLFLDLEKALN